jgi:hypothetical protein
VTGTSQSYKFLQRSVRTNLPCGKPGKPLHRTESDRQRWESGLANRWTPGRFVCTGGRGQRSGSCCGTILREHVMNHSRHYTTARLGRWLPADPKPLNDWLTKAIETAEQKKAPFHPVVDEFRAMIENDPRCTCTSRKCFNNKPPPLRLLGVSTSVVT